MEQDDIQTGDSNLIDVKIANQLVIGERFFIGGNVARINDITKNYGGGHAYMKIEFSVGELGDRWGEYFVRSDEMFEVLDS